MSAEKYPSFKNHFEAQNISFQSYFFDVICPLSLRKVPALKQDFNTKTSQRSQYTFFKEIIF